MKVSYVVIVSAMLGVALGAGITWANFHDTPPLVAPQSIAPPVRLHGLQPKLLVDERFHDFGAVERDTKVRHVFHFTNLGKAPLTLKAGATSCSKCTVAELTKTQVSPGETADVTIEYLSSSSQPRIRQWASILTNDPDEQRVELTIVGTVTAKYRVVPTELVLSKVSANETKTADIKIYAFLADGVQVEKYEFTGQETAPYFEVHSEPISRDQLTEPDAKSGCRVAVTVKPGLPLGPIRQTIRLELKMAGFAERPTVEVPIEGTVDSDISVVGKGWNGDLGRLAIGAVKRAEGATRHLRLIVRGPHRHGTVIKPGKIDPTWLKVTVGEPSELKQRAAGEGGVTQIPLTIEIPPGSPQTNRLGFNQGKYAEIFLETTHPQVQQIRMYLQFVVEQ
jgi:uncharacterized protein DUF1573